VTIGSRTERALKVVARGGAGTADVFRETMRQISSDVPSDGWCGLTLDPTTLVATGGVHEHGLGPVAIRRLLEIEYGEDEVNLFVDLARARSPAAALSVALGAALDQSPRFRDVLVPSGYGDELRVVLRAGGSSWGALVLFRTTEQPAFSKDEVALVARVSEPAAEALRWSLVAESVPGLASLTDRALLVLGASNTVESATPEAQRLLEDLAEEGPPDPANVPHTIQAVALEARRRARDANEEGLVSRSRARTRRGQWVTLHASTLGSSEQVAVFVEPSRPLEIASLILRAYGLTKREGEIVRLVLHGLDTEQIAEALGISLYTVQDHLKSIFDKAGVSSRKELVARIFFTHYLPRMSSRIGPDGWFADDPLPRR
jgi:DNA-binding CsgD family transcriptional regulator